MSETNERNLENTAPETVEDTIQAEPEVQQKTDDNENAPRVEPAAEKQEGGRKKKKRKRAKIALPAAAMLLVIALLFGMVVGYGLGRGVGAQRLRDAQAQIAALTEAFEDAAAAPVYSEFNEALTGENQSALEDLSGQGFENEAVSELAGEDALLSQMLEGGEQESVVVAEYTGGAIMSDEAAVEYEDQLASLIFAGYSEEEIAGTLLDTVLRYMVSDRILEQKAKEMGLYELTEADQKDIDAAAQAAYDEQLDFYRSFVNTAGMTDEEAAGAVKSYLEQNEGVTLESLRVEIAQDWWTQKLYNEITRDVTVDEAQLQAAYDSLVAEQKESFEAYAQDYEFAQVNGETIVYNLPGYRAVRMLMFALEDAQSVEAVSALNEEIAGLNPETDAEEIARVQAEIDACYAPAQERAQAALAELQAGADFEAMLDGGDDEGMRSTALRETGYYVSEASLLWPRTMIDAAMELQSSGDLSGIVRLDDGVCILEYVGEVSAGEVPLEDVRSALEQTTLENARDAAYEERLNEWLEQANAVYYPERMQ